MEIFLAVKTLKAWLQVVIKSDLKYFKALNRRVLWLTRACQVACRAVRESKDWQIRGSSPYTRREADENASIAEASLYLAFLEAYAKWLGIIEPEENT